MGTAWDQGYAGGTGPTAGGGPPGPPRPGTTPTQRVIGVLLLVPALVVLLTQQLIPTVQTMLLSTRGAGFGFRGEFVGLDNYQQIGPEWFATVGTTFMIGLGVGIVGAAVGIGLGVQLRRAPLIWQRVGLGVLGAALVTYGPASTTFALFYNPAGAGPELLLLRGSAAVLALLVLIGAVSGALIRSAAVLLAIGTVTAVAAATMTVQSELALFAQEVPGRLIIAFDSAATGPAAAMSVLLGILLAVLGIGAGVFLLATRPRFDATAHPPTASGPAVPQPTRAPGSSAAGVLAVVLCVVVALGLVILALPWLSDVGTGAADVEGGQAEAAATTWQTVGIRAVEIALTVLVTGLAAFGLGYLRPFGEHSRRGLLVVAPWFFVGLLPLVVAIFAAWSPEAPGPPYAGLTPQLLAVPLLFAWTFLADGLRTARDLGRRVRWAPVLGLTVLTTGMLVVVRSQQLTWDLMFMFSSDWMTAAQMVNDVLARTFAGIIPLGILTPPPLLVVGALVCGGAAALLPGARLLPARELVQRLAGEGQPAQHGQPAGPTYPQPDQTPHPQGQQTTWADPHR